MLRQANMEEGFDAAECKLIWDQYDTNNNGVLERSEVQNFFRDYCNAKNLSSYRQRNEIDRLFRLFDKNGDGKIEWNEFCKKDPLPQRRPRLRRQPSNPSSDSKLDRIFDRFADEEEKDLMFGDGLVNFCNATDLNAEDWTCLALAWKLDAENIGEISRDEFKEGFYNWGATDIKEMKRKCRRLTAQMSSDNEMYHGFYVWCFDYFKEEEKKVMPVDEANEAWTLLMRNWSAVGDWTAFTEAQGAESKRRSVITKDLWREVWFFAKKVLPDCSNFDDVDEGDFPMYLEDYVNHKLGRS